ncbi:hypothetical protein KC318_g7349 [Hortaea werneckii]|uniref:Uncharacterized protein n=1 Tax=Hortaea werneckii TaxID=91943 RepID=A0A3M6XRW7_HORWE|nr:hypothetical protein KC334_g16826 [Hortaea werneckii]KAI7013225.1 hypothetical protein KC355_g5121 [Hortaea werneckii]KAI7665052.1 hypothetical protein KC318_g7349 [Hortaea werneckii]RMX93553.1 hypothetical protein D0867_14168 [Hortaea werneckii]RMY13048.1 hypothetical protein D0866_14127 [Hortaea werneckii]
MPKAAKQTTHTKKSRTTPITSSKPTPQNGKATHQPKDPKTSHLYTDDNPSTTIHGTGFKDAATAHHTLDLIKNRSLTYQFQTVNTMFHRASHHPAMKKTSTSTTTTSSSSSSGSGGNSNNQQGMRDAISIFRHWLDDTYLAAKSALRAGGFKPLLSKPLVEKYLPLILSSSSSSGLKDDDDAKAFAQRYINLAKGKRLGNVLLDDADPTGLDWEGRRYRALCGLVPEGKEGVEGWGEGELWEDGDGDEGDGRSGGGTKGKGSSKKVSNRHLQLIAWAWSPVAERKLMFG